MLATVTDVSRNGCWVNNIRIAPKVPFHLRDGDILLLSKAPADPTHDPPVLGRIAYRVSDMEVIHAVQVDSETVPDMYGEDTAPVALPASQQQARRGGGHEEAASGSASQQWSSNGWQGNESMAPPSQYEAPFSQSQGWPASQLAPVPMSQEGVAPWPWASSFLSAPQPSSTFCARAALCGSPSATLTTPWAPMWRYAVYPTRTSWPTSPASRAL